jgi:enoyl-CoA hydratase/carnithine racemase
LELMMSTLMVRVPERLDAASVEGLHAQMGALDGADAITFEGVPGRFCLGMTFVEQSVPGAPVGAGMRDGLRSFRGLMEKILNCPRPTLAVVDGPAFGGGLGLASACDFVLASTRARFSLPEALYGLMPAIIRPALLTRLTIQKLNMLLFTCHSRTAEEARCLGLVDRLVTADELEKAKLEIIRHFRRAKTATVVAARQRNSAAVAEALDAGLAETAAALADERVVAALAAAAAEDQEPPWNSN